MCSRSLWGCCRAPQALQQLAPVPLSCRRRRCHRHARCQQPGTDARPSRRQHGNSASSGIGSRTSSIMVQAAPGDQQASAADSGPYQMDTDVWVHKPAWCQPWAIVSTGVAVVAAVWAVSGHSSGWTAAASLPVAAWWYLFLVVMPAQFSDYAAGLNADQQRLWMERQQRQQQQQRQYEGRD